MDCQYCMTARRLNSSERVRASDADWPNSRTVESNLACDASCNVAACTVNPNVQVEGLTGKETAGLGLQLAEAVKHDILRQKVGRLPTITPWHT